MNNTGTKKTYPNITIMYGAANSLVNNKTIIFKGMCMDYQLAFTGRSSMLTITGIISNCGDVTDAWTFTKANIEWCGTEIEGTSGNYRVDGKSQEEFSNLSNEDVCAVVIDIPSNSNGGNTSSSASTTLDSSVQGVVWNFFAGQGFSPAAVAGIMGNVQIESRFNPKVLEEGGGDSAGLFQWRGYPTKTDRWARLDSYAKSKGKDWTDVTTQCEFALSEMKDRFEHCSKGNYGKLVTVDEYKTWNDINVCTEFFCRVFEAPKMSSANLPGRKKYAQQYYDAYNNGDTSSIGGTVGSTTGVDNSGFTPTVFVNPSRIFKRIINTYNEKTNGTFTLGKVDDSLWIAGLDTRQTNETAASFIQNKLCKFAVSAPEDFSSTKLIERMLNKDFSLVIDNSSAGFTYSVKNGKHCFESINFANKPPKAVSVTYGTQNSNVISFAVSNVGVMSMLGSTTDENGNVLISASALTDLYDESVTVKSITGVQTEEDQDYQNWYFGKFTAASINSSMSTTGLSSSLTSTWNDVEDYTVSAELSLWGENSETYSPGDYIDLTVIGADNVRHYSSGYYLITKIDETISSDGYIQTLTLLKNSGNIAGSSGATTVFEKINLVKDTTSTVTTYTSLEPNSKTEVPKNQSTNTYNRPVQQSAASSLAGNVSIAYNTGILSPYQGGK